MQTNVTSHFGMSYLGRMWPETILDKVFEYNGKNVLVHVSEVSSGSLPHERIKTIEVYYLIGKLYGITNNPKFKVSKIKLIEKPHDQNALERIIRNNLGIREIIGAEEYFNFNGETEDD